MKQFAFLALGFVLLATLALSGNSAKPVNATHLQSDSALESPLQFSSHGHVLAFRSGDWFLSNGAYALGMTFLDAQRVTPHSDTPAAMENGHAAPFRQVVYENLWRGITLTYRTAPQGLVESVYELAPFANPDAIRLKYNAPVTLNADGTLTTRFETGEITESAPLAWQVVNGLRQPVDVKFRASADSTVSFALGAYDPSAPLYLDPTIVWHTFLGGDGSDIGSGIVLDADGNAYVIGSSGATWGTPKRAFGGLGDAFVAKLSANGALKWNTFLGGSFVDSGDAITRDADGNLYVAGNSYAAWGAPKRAYTSGRDGFAAKLTKNGVLVWHTFLGGADSDSVYNILVDNNSNAYLTGSSGETWGTPKRAYTGAIDGFVAKLNASGALKWHTFLGGSDSDFAVGIARDASNKFYVAGWSYETWGTPKQSFHGGTDVFVAKLNARGVLSWNTFFGSSGIDSSSDITVNNSGAVYLLGSSDATWGAPKRAYTADDDVFVAKLDSGGALAWNTFLGGSGEDRSTSIAVDNQGAAYIAGISYAAWGTPDRAYSGGVDASVAKVSANGAFKWSTFLGGTDDDSGSDIAAGPGGTVYVTGKSTSTWAALAPEAGGGSSAFVAKLK